MQTTRSPKNGTRNTQSCPCPPCKTQRARRLKHFDLNLCYLACSPENFGDFFLWIAWGLCNEKRRGFLVNIQWSPFRRKSSTNLVGPIRSRARSESFDRTLPIAAHRETRAVRSQAICFCALSIALQVSSFAVFPNFDRNFSSHLNLLKKLIHALIAAPLMQT